MEEEEEWTADGSEGNAVEGREDSSEGEEEEVAALVRVLVAGP